MERYKTEQERNEENRKSLEMCKIAIAAAVVVPMLIIVFRTIMRLQ